MPAITFDDFSGGLDRRLDIKVQDASRLWTLRNAFVTLGRRIRKRPGLKLEAAGLTGSYGLESISGRLKVFVDRGAGFAPPALVDAIALDSAPSASGSPLHRIHYADTYQAYPYVVAEYANGAIAHHYVDSTPSTVTITVAVPGVVSWTAHGLENGREVILSTTGALPTGLTAGTTYYVVSASTNSFSLAATKGGAAIDTTGTQSGVHTATAPTYITDVNCPNSISVTKAASRIFAIGGEVVRFCAVGKPRDWTTASDAGFLAASLQQDTKSSTTAVGTFQDALVVFFSEGAQIWNVAVDPASNSISKRIYGVGSEAPLSMASFSTDLVFLSPFGFRSMAVQAISYRIDDNDVGVPIDSMVRPDIATAAGQPDPEQPYGIWIHQLGQYWCVFDQGATSKAWVYTFSKTSKIACWSEYTFPFLVKNISTLNGKVYLRTVDELYSFDADLFTDDGDLIDVEVQMAYQSAKTPGISKQVFGADFVLQGSASVSYKYDPRDQTKESIPQTITSDTRPGDLVPVDIVSPAIAPVFRHSLDEAFEIDAVTLYYYPLGPM
ncbi:MAG TPA: hypothetical protein VFM48_08250 [Aquabacterium sp.]|nr:hypothetical protein [Aquabacterium sp.]